MRTYLLLLLYCIGFVHIIHAQEEMKAPIVIIKSGEQGFEEVGAGIIVGQQSNSLFILTAYHVIEHSSKVSIRFYGTLTDVAGTIVQSSNRWDMAVLQCPKPANFTSPKSFRLSKNAPTFREHVTVIGHPGSDYWFLNIENAVNDLKYDFDDRLFTITTQSISPGTSGGAVLNDANELMGMVQKDSPRKTIILSIKAIEQILSDWHVPMNLIQDIQSPPPKPSNLVTDQDYTDPMIGDMVYVEGGSYKMGDDDYEDERPPHTVRVPTFFMGKYEVTQAQWRKIMENNPSTNPCEQCPVENVSWYDVQNFITKLNQTSPYTYRLPSESEWEYAAKGGAKKSKSPYAGGDNLEDVAWYVNNANGITHPVGKKKPNRLQLYDMSGNVLEWCEDWYHNSYRNAPSDGSVWLSPSGNSRVLRGGSWRYGAVSNQVNYRNESSPNDYSDHYGFRLARTP